MDVNLHFKCVKYFYDKFRCTIETNDDALLEFRKNICVEESMELFEAMDEYIAHKTDENLAHVIKELMDYMYVGFGLAITLGVPFHEAFMEVHLSNMSKSPNPDQVQKTIKGPNYKPADMMKIVRKMRATKNAT